MCENNYFTYLYVYKYNKNMENNQKKLLKNSKFIDNSSKIHGNKYDYSLVDYVNARTKVEIICEEHGIFSQLPNNHTRGNGCPMCLYNKKNIQQIIDEFKKAHGNKYDYSSVIYKNTDTNIKIKCLNHGFFEQTPYNHKSGSGCPKCSGRNLDNYEIINELKKIHRNKYDYSKTICVNSKSKIKIICPQHGEFCQTVNNHKRGQGCSECNGNRKKDKKTAIIDFKKIHKDKYDYSKSEYKNAHTKLTIICPTHGGFLQTPHNHKNGNGCPVCNESKGENIIRNFLSEHNISFIPQYTFSDCKNILCLPFDFYLPKYNVCIEYNGLQHYKAIKYFGGDDGLEKRQKNDKIKMRYCKENNISLIIIKYNDNVINKLKNYIKT